MSRRWQLETRSVPWRVALLLALPIAIPMQLGCAGTDTGNPFTKPVIIDAHTSEPESVALQAGDGSVVTTLWIGLDTLTFIGGNDCNEPLPSSNLALAELAGNERLDVTANVSDADLCHVEVTLAKATASASEPTLEGNTVLVRGTTAEGTPFELHSALDTTVVLRADSGDFTLDDDDSGLFVGVDVAKWFSDLDIEGGERDANGTVRIDSANNSELLTEFDTTLAQGIAMYLDPEKDGEAGANDTKVASGE